MGEYMGSRDCRPSVGKHQHSAGEGVAGLLVLCTLVLHVSQARLGSL